MTFASSTDPLMMSMRETFIKPEDSAKGVIRVIDGTTKDKGNGEFLDYTGEKTLPW